LNVFKTYFFEKMTHFAHLRVSASKQDIENQKLSGVNYCSRHRLVPVRCIKIPRSLLRGASLKRLYVPRFLAIWGAFN